MVAPLNCLAFISRTPPKSAPRRSAPSKRHSTRCASRRLQSSKIDWRKSDLLRSAFWKSRRTRRVFRKEKLGNLASANSTSSNLQLSDLVSARLAPVILLRTKIAALSVAPRKFALLKSQPSICASGREAPVKSANAPRQPSHRAPSNFAPMNCVRFSTQRSNIHPGSDCRERSSSSRSHRTSFTTTFLEHNDSMALRSRRWSSTTIGSVLFKSVMSCISCRGSATVKPALSEGLKRLSRRRYRFGAYYQPYDAHAMGTVPLSLASRSSMRLRSASNCAKASPSSALPPANAAIPHP